MVRLSSGVRRTAAVLAAAGAVLAAAVSAAAQTPTVSVIVNDTQFRENETLAMGVTVANPAGNPAADLYVGIVLPGGQSQMYFTGPGAVSAPISSQSPALFPRLQAAPPGFTLNAIDFFQFTFPELGVPPGTYVLFASLVRPGALADNRFDPGDVLAFHQVAVNFGEGFSLSPTEGPSGTLVAAVGSGFSPSSSVTVAGVPAAGVVFTSPTSLSFVIPYATAGAAPASFAAGPASVQIDGRPAQTFTVTSPPANPNPPGALLQGAVTATGAAIGSSRGLIDTTFTALATQAATADVTSYTAAMQAILTDLEGLFQQDLGGLSGELDVATLGLVEQSLIDPAAPPPGFLPAAAVAPRLAGDLFLQQRLALVTAGNRAGRSALALTLLCPATPSRLCRVAGAAFSLTSLAADLLVGSLGSVTGLEMDANVGVVRRTPAAVFVLLRPGQVTTLSSTLITNRVVNGLDAVKLALKIRTARTFIRQALMGPPVPPGMAGRLERLATQLATLEALAATLTADVPLGGPTRQPLSFVNVKGSCPSDLLSAVTFDGVLGTVSVSRTASFPVTRLCSFRVEPVFVSKDESTVTAPVWFTVQP